MPSDARGFRTGRADEVARKVERVAALARDLALDGILLSTQHNFSWLSGGGSNRVDALRESGVATLMVTADGLLYLLANVIESRRIAAEALPGIDVRVVDYPWQRERQDSGILLKMAAEATDGRAAFGTDAGLAGATHAEGRIARLRQTFDESEIPRYRSLSQDAGAIVGEMARNVAPGTTESEIARRVGAALITADMRPAVVLVGGDDRIDRYRHPVPTDATWTERLLIAVCAERHGMVTALTRLVTTRPDAELARRTRATADVFAALLGRTIGGATGADLYDVAREAYAKAGFAGQEHLHHLGGAIAYRAREWVAHPHSTDVVMAPQAFAWNPTITGTKVEETCLLQADGTLEVLTSTDRWPSIVIGVRSQRLHVPDALVLGA